MVEKRVKCCDVFDSNKDIKTFEVVIREVPDHDGGVKFNKSIDLSKRGYGRMMKFLERGTRPPTKKETVDG